MASKNPYTNGAPLENAAETPKITRVFESSCPSEINLLLDAGASFLGTTVRRNDQGEIFVYAVGIPDNIQDLPRWGIDLSRHKASIADA